MTLNILHFKADRSGNSHFHLHVKVNLLVKQTALEWKVPGRLMRCVFPLFHTILLFIPLFVCRAVGPCVGVHVGWPGNMLKQTSRGDSRVMFPSLSFVHIKQGASVSLFRQTPSAAHFPLMLVSSVYTLSKCCASSHFKRVSSKFSSHRLE